MLMDVTAESYADAVGVESDDSYRLSWDELVRLIADANKLGAYRLEMLKALQTELSRDDDESVAELKDLLTNLIIMQTRLAGREADLDEALANLSGAPPASHIEIAKEIVVDTAQKVLDSSHHISGKGVQGGKS